MRSISTKVIKFISLKDFIICCLLLNCFGKYFETCNLLVIKLCFAVTGWLVFLDDKASYSLRTCLVVVNTWRSLKCYTSLLSSLFFLWDKSFFILVALMLLILPMLFELTMVFSNFYAKQATENDLLIPKTLLLELLRKTGSLILKGEGCPFLPLS